MENQTVKSSRKKLTRAPRFKAAFPVRLGGVNGVTKDISATGIFLEMPEMQEVGTEINLEVELNTLSGKQKLKLAGEVVRVEKKDGRIGLAIKINN